VHTIGWWMIWSHVQRPHRREISTLFGLRHQPPFCWQGFLEKHF
jgi:hypothetical protein